VNCEVWLIDDRSLLPGLRTEGANSAVQSGHHEVNPPATRAGYI
jgi:hypothetical protein